MIDASSFAGNLIQTRRRRGLTQYQLAAAAGVQRGVIAHLEAARNWPSLDVLCALARALECTADSLLLVRK